MTHHSHHHHHHSRHSPSKRRRTRSPDHHDRHTRTTDPSPAPPVLSYNAPRLSRHRSWETYQPLFGLYLDVQKQLVLEELDETEVKGRWKSFVGKWNQGTLAEGWYDPATLQKAVTASTSSLDEPGPRRRKSPVYDVERAGRQHDGDSESDDDFVGPELPSTTRDDGGGGKRAGAAAPKMDDLLMRREETLSTARQSHSDTKHLHKHAQKSHRLAQKAELDDLLPKPDPGTHAARLEKRAALNEKMSGYRDRSPGGEVNDGELMGGGEADDLHALKRRIKEEGRKKNEREVRKDEMLRARAEEREERLREYRAKEDKTMEYLRAVAKQNFG
ncbi:MAG: hypothetical protein M1817_002985 [Caeruleum heppii]|nr:MAG: hypothetical protein M1817_002985 [Caeruleum heppii]